MNPAGFSYAGYALRDCIQEIRIPVIEVHLTNHFARDIHSVTAAAASGLVMGLGVEGYYLALDAALRVIAARRATYQCFSHPEDSRCHSLNAVTPWWCNPTKE